MKIDWFAVGEATEKLLFSIIVWYIVLKIARYMHDWWPPIFGG